MQLALECPTRLLEHIQPFADFYWILAHKVLQDKVYKEYYEKVSGVKFVDNSVNELGEPVSLGDMKKAFEQVKGTYVVAPDWIGNGEKTCKAYLECLKEFGEERVVPVIQGSTFIEVVSSYEIISGTKTFIAVPYDICSKKTDPPWLMSLRRAMVVKNIIPTEKPVHLLGLTSLDEFFWYHGAPNVVSIDTGVPILLGLMEKDILEPLVSKDTPTWNEMEKMELGKNSWAAICRNLALLRKLMP